MVSCVIACLLRKGGMRAFIVMCCYLANVQPVRRKNFEGDLPSAAFKRWLPESGTSTVD